jgi:hypothetical protein
MRSSARSRGGLRYRPANAAPAARTAAARALYYHLSPGDPDARTLFFDRLPRAEPLSSFEQATKADQKSHLAAQICTKLMVDTLIEKEMALCLFQSYFSLNITNFLQKCLIDASCSSRRRQLHDDSASRKTYWFAELRVWFDNNDCNFQPWLGLILIATSCRLIERSTRTHPLRPDNACG